MHPIALSVWRMIVFFEVVLNIGVGIKDFAIEGIITEDAFEPVIEMLENVVLIVCVNQFNKVKLIKNTKWKSDFVGFYA